MTISYAGHSFEGPFRNIEAIPAERGVVMILRSSEEIPDGGYFCLASSPDMHHLVSQELRSTIQQCEDQLTEDGDGKTFVAFAFKTRPTDAACLKTIDPIKTLHGKGLLRR